MREEDWLGYRARATPDRPALLAGGAELTFRELEARAGRWAARLGERGVGRGDRVAVLLPNGYRFSLLVHALMRLRSVLVPLNTRLAAPEVLFQVGDARPQLLVRDAAFAGVGAALAAAHPHVPQWVLPHEDDAVAADRARGEAAPPAEGASGDLHAIVYTSGTTGRPKGAMLTYGNHWHSAIASTLNLGHHLDDRWLLCLPMFHVGGLAVLLRGVIGGTAVRVLPGFDPDAVNRALDGDGITLVSMVSHMLRRTLEARGGRPFPRRLRLVLLGGGPAPLPLLEACAARGLAVVQSYGLTETASQVVALAPEDALAHLGSAGRPLPGNRLRIAAAPGEAGEILVAGPSVMAGYYNRPEATAAALREGWLHTGDVGRVDGSGLLTVLARRDDLIVRGGENVYPAEIESVLAQHPLVAECAVAAAPDPRWGQAPVAYVRPRPGAAADPSELIAFCRERLAGYKVPVRVVLTGPLPRNAAGKLMRRELGGAP